DRQGYRQWDRTYGGSDADQLFSLQQTQDQGFILGSASASNHSVDKSQDSKGGFDYWVIRLGSPPAAGLPVAHIAGDSVICSQPIQLTATSNGLIRSYRWNTGATTASISVGQPGTYTVVLTFAGGVTATAQQVVTAFPTTLRIQGDTLLCPGSSGRLTARAAGALAYEWSTGEHTSTIAITQPGTYTVTASYTGSCTSTRQIQVSALSLRIAGASELCTGTPTTLTAQTIGASSFAWSTGATTPTITVTQPGTYQVEVRFTNGCVLSASHTLTQPRATIRGDSLLCAGHSGQLMAVAPGATAFRWSTGTTTAAVTITQPGLYTVLITYSSGCQRSLSQRVEMEPPIGAFSLGADTTICEGAALLLRAPLRPLAGLTYRWSTGATTPTLLVQQAGEYSVQLSTACETHTATRRLLMRPCLTIPNVITPNADRLNDCFVIQGLTGEWTLTLYSRWGQQVYTTAAYHNDWGATATAGTYYYILSQPNSSSSYKGWLEVIR
ncbi:MAG: gliding motility-associated C-terminal domain-containing protein, partial [Hymenobacter sp.]